MVSVRFNRFINYYKKTRDLSSQSGERRERGDDRDLRNNGGATRYFVNIGSRDNFDGHKRLLEKKL
jgi:ATP-dependent RNA helicase DeaD